MFGIFWKTDLKNYKRELGTDFGIGSAELKNQHACLVLQLLFLLRTVTQNVIFIQSILVLVIMMVLIVYLE